MLLQIREYFAREKIASNQQVARQFRLALEALQPMLDVWCAKGVIAAYEQKTGCQSACFKCQASVVYYRFILS